MVKNDHKLPGYASLNNDMFSAFAVSYCKAVHYNCGTCLADTDIERKNKMNVLLNEFSRMNPALVEYLTCCSDVSIYLSVSRKDTLRIVREVKPEVIIFCRNYAVESTFVQELSKTYMDLGIYLCETDSRKSKLELVNFRNYQSIELNVLVS